jgi:hypothetical protein
MTRHDLPSFDEMVRLAKENPAQLEAIRLEACQNLINQAPKDNQRQLHGLQFKIDMERRRAKTPMAACLKLSQMMKESFEELRVALQKTRGYSESCLSNFDNASALETFKNEQLTSRARVIPFTKKEQNSV